MHIDLKENTTKYVRHNDIPTLYFHAKDDDFVPLKMVIRYIIKIEEKKYCLS